MRLWFLGLSTVLVVLVTWSAFIEEEVSLEGDRLFVNYCESNPELAAAVPGYCKQSKIKVKKGGWGAVFDRGWLQTLKALHAVANSWLFMATVGFLSFGSFYFLSQYMMQKSFLMHANRWSSNHHRNNWLEAGPHIVEME